MKLGLLDSEKITGQEVNKIRTLTNHVTARTGTNNQITQKHVVLLPWSCDVQ